MHVISICLVIVFFVIGSVCAAPLDIIPNGKNEERPAQDLSKILNAVKSNNGQTTGGIVRDVDYGFSTEYFMETDPTIEELTTTTATTTKTTTTTTTTTTTKTTTTTVTTTAPATTATTTATTTAPATTAPATTDSTTATTTATTTITTITTTTTTITTTTTPVPLELDHEWEDLVLAGPTVVNYLGLFMVLASRRDEALIPPSNYTVQLITNINSLRATLSQVASAMQVAFQGAHEDLIRTQLSMDQIPEHAKAALVLIKTAPDDLLKKLLPYTLSNIDRDAVEGSTISKSTLARFVKTGKLIDELTTMLAWTPSIISNSDYLFEATAYITDIQTQWNRLVELFIKFSERADITRQRININFVNPIQQAQSGNNLTIEKDRAFHLQTLIRATIAIDQSSHLLQTMAHAYDDISNEHMVSQIATSDSFLYLGSERSRTSSQRQLWQNAMAQSVKVARLSMTRQNEFAESSSNRQKEYNDFLPAHAAAVA